MTALPTAGWMQTPTTVPIDTYEFVCDQRDKREQA